MHSQRKVIFISKEYPISNPIKVFFNWWHSEYSYNSSYDGVYKKNKVIAFFVEKENNKEDKQINSGDTRQQYGVNNAFLNHYANIQKFVFKNRVRSKDDHKYREHCAQGKKSYFSE